MLRKNLIKKKSRVNKNWDFKNYSTFTKNNPFSKISKYFINIFIQNNIRR